MNFTFKPVSIGVTLSILALLAGILHGMAFGANEDGLKDMFKKNAQAAFAGKPEEINEAAGGAWKSLKRAHMHFMGLGAMALALCLFAGLSPAGNGLKMGASIAVGFGAVVYPLHFTIGAFKASHLGKHAAHEAVEFVAIPGAGATLLGIVAMLVICIGWALKKEESAGA